MRHPNRFLMSIRFFPLILLFILCVLLWGPILASRFHYQTPRMVAVKGQEVPVNLPVELWHDFKARAYAVMPELPPGLRFDADTGAISGTPTASQPDTVYVVTQRPRYGGIPAETNQTRLSIAVESLEDRRAAGM
jgi:hypothetical protein